MVREGKRTDPNKETVVDHIAPFGSFFGTQTTNKLAELLGFDPLDSYVYDMGLPNGENDRLIVTPYETKSNHDGVGGGVLRLNTIEPAEISDNQAELWPTMLREQQLKLLESKITPFQRKIDPYSHIAHGLTAKQHEIALRGKEPKIGTSERDMAKEKAKTKYSKFLIDRNRAISEGIRSNIKDILTDDYLLQSAIRGMNLEISGGQKSSLLSQGFYSLSSSSINNETTSQSLSEVVLRVGRPKFTPKGAKSAAKAIQDQISS
jgi:hypothetical protein